MNELLSKWQNLIMGALIALVLVYGTYNYIYKPKVLEIKSLQNSLKLIDNEINLMPQGNLMLKDMIAAKAMLNEQLNELSKKVPSEVDTPYLLNNYISVVGNGLNIDYNLIQPGGLATEQNFKRLPFTVEFQGDYANLNLYLAQLKRLPVTIRVDTLELNKLSGTKKLDVRMALSAFVMPGGPAKATAEIKGGPFIYDPFYTERSAKPVRTGYETVKNLKYSGYWIGKQMEAIINDEIYGTGQSIQGFQIVNISKDKVLLKKNEKMFELPMEKK